MTNKRPPCWRVGQRVQQRGGDMALAGGVGGDVEAALREADRAAKKQKVCSASSSEAVEKLLQVGGWQRQGCRCSGAAHHLLPLRPLTLPGPAASPAGAAGGAGAAGRAGAGGAARRGAV